MLHDAIDSTNGDSIPRIAACARLVPYESRNRTPSSNSPVTALFRTCTHCKKVRGKSPRRYNSCVLQLMRHVTALRVSKAVLVFAIALFYTILVLNNITDYGSNYEIVRHVLMMDSTLPGNHGMWRAVNSPLVHTVFYISIIAWESVTMLLFWWAGVRLLKSYRADRAQFAAALNVAMIALTTSLLMWLVAFLDVGGEWFLMWQSKMWNGQEEAFRLFTIVGVVFLVVVQREPTPDSSAVLLWGGYFPLARDPGVSGIDSHKPASVLILPSMPSPALVRDDG